MATEAYSRCQSGGAIGSRPTSFDFFLFEALDSVAPIRKAIQEPERHS
jgi:hypothetical protein